nr:WD repeat, SAM and U-box domain-containing protein 1 isoform X2 [Nerophis lumbriciformis]
MVSLICTLQDHRDDVNWCAFSAQLLATCSGDKTVRVYNTRDFSELAFSPLEGHGYSAHCCCFSPCGQFLASCSTDATTLVWSMTTGEIEAVLEHPGRSPVRICVLSPDSTHLVSGASDGSLALWDFPSKQLRRTGCVSDTTMVACSFSPCSQMFVTGSTYGDLRVWDLNMTQLHAEKNAHDLGVTCCTFAPDILSGQRQKHRSKLLVSDWSEEDVSVWLLEEGLDGLVDTFKTNNIDGTELLALTKETLLSELHIESVGQRSKVLRKVEELKNASVCSGVPDEFLCPITRELMREPVLAADGYSYEREAITMWINTKNRSSPMTNLPLLTTLLTPNHTLKMAIARWRTSQ